MTTVSADRKRQFDYMLEDSSTPLPLDHFSNIVTEDRDLYSLPFGCVIDTEGQIHQLHVYATHGAIAAILCPEQAEAFGAPQPTGHQNELPVMAYQEFELEVGYRLPLVRISTRFGINISHGRGEFWPNAEQQKALKRFLIANDALLDEINTEVEGTALAHTFLLMLQFGERDTDYIQRKDEWKAAEQAEEAARHQSEQELL
jgi:hypothetical protein